MSWDNINILEIIRVIVNSGVAGTVAWIIATQVVKKYETRLRKREYVSKVRFDTEFLIYRELSKSFFNYVKAICIMVPPGYSEQPADPEARKKEDEEHYRKAQNAHVEAQDALHQNAPFIQKEFYEKYNEILKDGNLQLLAYRKRYNIGYKAPQSEKEEFELDDYQRSQKMENLMGKLNDDMRQYLAKLDVVE